MATAAIQKTGFFPAWAEKEFEAIRKRAFELFARRGPGDELADWLDAEREKVSNTRGQRRGRFSGAST